MPSVSGSSRSSSSRSSAVSSADRAQRTSADASRTQQAKPSPALDDVRAGKATLRQGARGDAVSAMQTALNNNPGQSLKVDGDFGPNTARAVRGFQATNGLAVDGVVGQNTLAAIERGARVESPAETQHQADAGTAVGSTAVNTTDNTVTGTPDAPNLQTGLSMEGDATTDGANGADGAATTDGADGATDVDGANAAPGHPRSPALDSVRDGSAVLERGNKGDAVTAMQEAYNAAHPDSPIDPDGSFGPGTEKALRGFQREMGMSETGMLDDRTLASLEARADTAGIPEGALGIGARGSEVVDAQNMLNAQGAFLNPDGRFGQATAAAVREFQEVNGMPPSGSIDTSTATMLENPEAKPIYDRTFAQGAPGHVNEAQLREIVPGLNPALAREVVPLLNRTLEDAGATTPKRAAAMIAQLAHESAGFTRLVEASSGRQYEGRKILGNVEKGDGARFRGRGWAQLTGRYNYTEASKALGIDLVNNPELAADPVVSSKVAAWFWQDRNLNSYADDRNLSGQTYRLNGGQNGMADRRAHYRRALRALGA